MKIISGLLLFILAGVAAYAQQEARVIAEIAASNASTIKNSPFSAEAISESVQTLADGNRIVRSSTSKLFRNSEGRFRREMSGGSGGVFSTSFSFGDGTTILDPVAGQRILLNQLDATARVGALGRGSNVTIARGGAVVADEKRALEMASKLANAQTLTEEQRAEYAAKAKEYRLKAEELRGSSPVVITGSGSVTAYGGDGTFVYSTGQSGKYDSRTEELGTRDFEGVMAEGTRRVTTIPAGAIGNEREIEIVYERWYSKELGLVVYSKHSDPRFGEQTYRITNLVRAEPDPSLFTVPNGYRVLQEATPVYKVSTKPSPARNAVSPRSSVRATQVSNERPARP